MKIRKALLITFAIFAVSREPLSQTKASVSASAGPEYKPRYSVLLTATQFYNDKTGAYEPAVALKVENVTDPKDILELPFPQVQVDVYLNGSEVPMTSWHKQTTHRLRESDVAVMDGGFEPLITPDHSFTRTYRLNAYYDMSKPGTYKVQISIMDIQANQGHWLKSNVVEVVVP